MNIRPYTKYHQFRNILHFIYLLFWKVGSQKASPITKIMLNTAAEHASNFGILLTRTTNSE